MICTPNTDAKLKSKTLSVALLLIVGTLTITSCVSNVSSQVKESDKDTSGAFDGTWIANVQKSPERQTMPGNWVANCDGTPWDFRVRITDGTAKNNLRGSSESAFVSTTGDFRFEIPVKSEAKAAPSTEQALTLAKQTIVVYGNLKKGKGRYTFAVAEFGNNGCSATIKFEKIG